MAYYAQIDGNGICYAELETDGHVSAANMVPMADPGRIGQQWTGSAWVTPAAPAPTVRAISGVAFLRRFTQAQRIAIRNLGKTDPIVDDILRLLDAAIAQGGDVNLLDSDTVAGIGYLATAQPAQNINPAVILA